jgi:salicylate hydroxylase/6-hydroxynicotinate 3-monooxygenase
VSGKGTSTPSIAIVGAGIGGLTVAATLRGAGIEAHVYEQASRFARVGAGIQMTPNAMRVLRGIGLEDHLVQVAFRPTEMRNREWDSGELTFELPLGDTSAQRYGAPYLLLHRGDLHEALTRAVPEESVHRDRHLVDLEERTDGVRLGFADGTNAGADAVIGADGVHSCVREILLGPEAPRFTHRVAYRTVYPVELLGGLDVDPSCKWWGSDRHIVIYHISGGREVYFTTSVPEDDWQVESWSATGSLSELRAAFDGFHPHVRAVLDACPQVHKWAIFERDPLPRWCSSRVALLGDACHPMTPYMAQGAAASMEDAAVLTRCLAGATPAGVPDAFARYEAARKPRTSQLQLESRANTWLRHAADPSWVYGYDAWQTPLQPGASGVGDAGER